MPEEKISVSSRFKSITSILKEIISSYMMFYCALSPGLIIVLKELLKKNGRTQFLVDLIENIAPRIGTNMLHYTIFLTLNILVSIISILIVMIYLSNMRTLDFLHRWRYRKYLAGKLQLRLARFTTDVLFRMSMFLLVNSSSCISIYELADDTTQIYLDKEVLNDLEQGNSITQNYVYKEIKVLILNKGVVCYSTIHYLFAIVCAINLSLLFISRKLGERFSSITFSREWLEVPNKASYVPSTMILGGIVIFNSLTTKNIGDLDALQSVMLVEVIGLLIIYAITHYYKPNYNKKISELFQIDIILILFALLYFWLVILLGKVKNSENSNQSWIVLALLTPIVIKIHFNSNKMSLERSWKTLSKMPKDLRQEDILFLYFQALEYFKLYKAYQSNPEGYIKELETSNLFWMQVFQTVGKRSSDNLAVYLEGILKENEFFVHDHNEFMLKSTIGVLDNLMAAFIRNNPDDKTVFLLYLNFLLDAKGGFTRAFILIFAKEGERGARHLAEWERGLMKDKLEELLNTHLEICIFSKMYEEKITSDTEQKDTTGYLKIIQFIDRYNLAKKKMLRCLKSVYALMIELLSRGDIYKIHVEINKCYRYKYKVEDNLVSLFEEIDGRYTPLLKVLFFYYKTIDCNVKKANFYLKRLAKNKVLYNMNLFASDGYLKQLLIVIISGEGKDFHEIKDLYGRFEIVNQDKSKLLGKDLTAILPNVVRPIHRTFIQKSNSYGSLMESDQDITVYAMGLDGYVTRVDAKVRITFSYLNGIRFLAYLFAPKRIIYNEMIAIVSPGGVATDVTKEFSKFIRPGLEISFINPSLKHEIEKLNLVMSSFRNQSYQEIMADPKLTNAWKSYFEFRRGKMMNVFKDSPTGRIIIKAWIIIEELSFRHIHHIWILKACIPGAGNEETYLAPFNPSFISGRKFENVEFFLNCLKQNSERDQNIESQESSLSEIEEQERVLKPKGAIGKLTRRAPILFITHSSREVFNGLKGEHPSHQQDHNSDNNRHVILNTDLQNVLDRSYESEKYSVKSVDSKKEVNLEGEGLEKLNLTMNLNQGSESSLRDYQKKEVGFIRQQLRNRKRWTFGLLQSFIVLLISGLLYYAQALRRETFRGMNLEIRDQSKTIDWFSWEVLTNAYIAHYLDICRIVKNKEFPNDYISIYRNGTTMIELCHNELRTYGAFQINVELMINGNIELLRYPELYQLERWRNTIIELYSYKREANGSITWKLTPYPRVAGFMSFSGFAKRFVQRDYLLDEDIPVFKMGNNERDKDPEEEMFRRNVANSLAHQVSLRSYEFYDYLKGVIVNSKEKIKIELYGTMAATIIFIFVMSILLYFEIHQLQYFYGLLFQMKVTTK